ncbi:mevalonate kinase [Paraoerskovia sediminicola]|uniref:Mevalonate kinase n=1 Tax=Paraoerskovia sediminicola TaxID=1138587 RepID=A0ABN6XFK3_9CELL|nr:mevalonate kinase [Paraoerskovia sediminicola]BDZ43565.1 mevalonate kinase [Paraoerskovia sediminicola]
MITDSSRAGSGTRGQGAGDGEGENGRAGTSSATSSAALPVVTGAAPSGPAADGEQATGSAHAKVILLGEHAVVHGRPAIALALPHLRVTVVATRTTGAATLRTEEYAGPLDRAPDVLGPLVTAARATSEHLGCSPAGVDLAVRTGIPVGRGLGASAAAAHAIVDALVKLHGSELDEEGRFDLVQVAERVAHGRPSGLDARATRASGALLFRAGRSTPLPVALGTSLVVADTGVRGTTREAVADVAAFVERSPHRGSVLLDRLESLTLAGAEDLAQDRREALGGRMTAAHDMLSELGAGHPALDRLVEAAVGAGALGAKLTGGGQGGCVLALAPTPEDADRIVDALESAGAVGSWVLPPAASGAAPDRGRAS